MQKLKSTSATDTAKGQVFFRIMPVSIKKSGTLPGCLTSKWLLYLQKGMQILGKTSTFEIAAAKGEYKFDANQNKFDFQMVSEKNFAYAWSLYAVDNQGLQERIGDASFSVKDYYQKYEKEPQRGGYSIRVTIKDNFVLIFKLIIQNTAINIVELVNGVVPQAQDDLARALAGIGKKAETPRLSAVKSKSLKQEHKQKNNQQKQHHQILRANTQSPKALNFQQPKKDKKSQNIDQIEEQQEQQSIISDSKNKLASVPSNLSQLQNIIEQKEKQDLATPMNIDNKIKSIDNAFSAAIQQQEQHQQDEINAGIQQNQPQILTSQQSPVQVNLIEENTAEAVQNTASPVQQQQEIKVRPKKVSISRKGSIQKNKTQTEGAVQSGNKIKKLIIVFLVLILIGGIVGAIMSPKQEADQVIDDGKKKKKSTTKKSTKASKQ